MRHGICVLAVVAVLSHGSAAWSFGGCPPATKNADKCEIGIAKAMGKFASAVIKCHTAQADAAFKGKPADDEACESGGPKSAKAKLDAAIAKVASLCPPGVTTNAGALEDALLNGSTSLDAMNGLVYCDASSGVAIDGGGDDAGWVPPSKVRRLCADGVDKSLGVLWSAIVKCSTKAADSAFKGKGYDEAGCRAAATTKYDAAGAKLMGCPTCLDQMHRTNLRNTVLSRVAEADTDIFVCPAATTSTTSTTSTSTTSTTTTVVTTTTSTTTTTTSTTLLSATNCSAGGTVDVVMLLVPTPTTFNSSVILGLQVDLTYQSNVSMPGTHFLPVGDPADPTTLIALLSADPSGVNLYDGSQTFFDADSSPPFKLQTFLSLNDTANLYFNQVIGLERARFTCTPGNALVASSLSCVVSGEVDVTSRNVPPDQRPNCTVGFGS